MNAQIIFHSLLTMHIIGLVILAGTTFINYILFTTFWKIYNQQKEKSVSLLQVMSRFPMLIGIGGGLMILTGIGIMALTHGVFGEQLWFRIKFGLIIILILNGLLVGRRQGLKLRKVMENKNSESTQEINRIRIITKRSQLFQLAIFLTIILLSVFKFN